MEAPKTSGEVATSMEETEDVYELINKMRTVQAMNDTSIAETHVTKKIDSDSIYLVGYGDLHIENLGTDLDRIEAELKIMSRIPNLYVVFMGDLTDSSVKYLNNNFDTYLTPKAAREFGYRIFDTLGEKLICALSGCHEKHSEEMADFDYVEEYCKQNHVPFLNERGLLTLELANERRINIAVAHKAQGYSMYNPFHPAIRIIREHYPDADVVITAHQHQSGIAIQNEQGKPRAMMTIGTRKQGDRYATRRGFQPQSQNKNLPVLEVLSDGYKIMNDMILLDSEDENERERIIGKSLLKCVANNLAKKEEEGRTRAIEHLRKCEKESEEKQKLEKLKAMGFKNAVPEKEHKTMEVTEEYNAANGEKASQVGERKDREKAFVFDAPNLKTNHEKKEAKHIVKARKGVWASGKTLGEYPPTDAEKKIDKRRMKDRNAKQKQRNEHPAEVKKYMRNYMREYRKKKKIKEVI